MTEPLNLDHDFDVALVGRYVTDAASPAERSALEQWIAADPRRRELITQLEVLWREAGTLDGWKGTHDDVDVEAHLRSLSEAMQPTPSVASPSQAARTWRGSWIYAAAAAVVLSLGAGLLWTNGVGRPRSEAAVPAPMREYVTARGQRAEFRLPDGTQVMLNVASRLRIPVDYGVRDRRLYLTGAAYFDVQHDSTSRFLVHAGGAVMEDLGTRFAVRAYASDSAVQVVVAKGRVALRSKRREAVLKAGELALAVANGGIARPRGENVERALAWTEGRIEFENTPLKDALPELNRWFDLDFRLGDASLDDWRVTGSFESRPDDWTLKELALTLGLGFQRRGRVVTLYPAHGTGK